MPPIHSKPRSMETSNDSDTIDSENRPTLSIDLSEIIINNAVTKFKSSTLKNNKRKRKFKFPCSICEKSVNKNQKSVYCNNCDLWVHKKCEGLSNDEFQKLVEEDDEVPWFCLVCQIKLNAEIFPFGVLSKFELLDLYGIDLPSHLQTLPSFETHSKLENLPHINDSDIDDNIVNTIFSKYHTLNEISQLNLSRKNFSIFHTNIRSLSKHIDSLHTQLCSTNIPFDIIGITETKQQVDKNFLVHECGFGRIHIAHTTLQKFLWRMCNLCQFSFGSHY